MKDTRREFLGSGLAFPLQVNAKGEIALVTGERDIEQSIAIILGTRQGERVMRPEFGCRVHELLFERQDTSTVSLVRYYVREALTRWEPRIDVMSVDVSGVSEPDGALLVHIEYFIKTTHDQRSIVYPFFLANQESW